MAPTGSGTEERPATSALNQRVAVVTGGGRGIGRAVATALHADGWKIAIAGRTPSSLEETAAALNSATPGETTAIAVVADVSQPGDVERLFSAAVERFGSVDLLFNNAGVAAPAVAVDALDVEDWNHVVAVNLTGSFLCARAAFAQMRNQAEGGRIINNGSVSATTPRPFSAPYTATKHAITGLTKSLSLDGRELGIKVGQIDIGNASSEMVERIASGVIQPDGSTRPEATMAIDNVGAAVVYMANLPADANVLFMTVMANAMPFVGRG